MTVTLDDDGALLSGLDTRYRRVGARRPRREAIGTRVLDPYKAGVLLRGLLAGEADRGAIAAAFAAAGGIGAP